MRVVTILLALSLPAAAAEPSLAEQAKAIFKPLPAQLTADDNPITQAKVELGRQLFFETRLSKGQAVSCNSCHDLGRYGVDGERFSTGQRGQKGGRNAPTVYNAAHHVAQFWDGRAKSVEEQAKGPVLNPVEMAMKDPAAVDTVLRSIPGYAPLFAKAFPGEKDPVGFDNAAKAIGAFERTLVTPSRFDRFLAGDEKALTEPEQKGLETFISAGCVTCHNGEGVGGGSFMKLGLARPVEGLKDNGRFDVTHDEADRFVFRVPSLRNVEKTGPYLHDGSLGTLKETVGFMSLHQLGRPLTVDQTQSIVTFLGALTGPLPPKALIAPPRPLPKGKATPPPDAS